MPDPSLPTAAPSTQRPGPRLVVVPSETIESYERKGLDWLARYYNPGSHFSRVFALSPIETGRRTCHGMRVIGVHPFGFRSMLHRIAPIAVRAYGGYWASDFAVTHSPVDIPVIVSVHDPNPALLHRSILLADLVICVSRMLVTTVQRLGVDPMRIRLVPNRIDPTVFHPATDPHRTAAIKERLGPGIHLLHVGRRSQEKNLDTVIRSLTRLPDHYRLTSIGRGSAEPYRQLAGELGVLSRCQWIDAVPNRELPHWYAACHCMCNPSRWEGFGLVFIEAAACGTPIVTSDIAPLNEFLQHETSAHLEKNPTDPAALATAIRLVCENRAYRTRLSRGAIRAAAPFHREKIDAREVEIYREAVHLRLEKPRNLMQDAGFRINCRISELLSDLSRARAIIARLFGRWRSG